MIQFTDGGQLRTHGKMPAYLNCHHGSGHVAVWTIAYEKPTYLIRATKQHMEIWLIQFDDDDWAKEWFDENPNYEILMRLDGKEPT